MNTQTHNHWLGRQGDVILTTHVYNDHDELVPVVVTPDVQVKPVSRTEHGLVLQHGAITGHSHHIPGAGAAMVALPNGARVLEVASPEAVDHDEHDSIDVPVGFVVLGIQVEYMPGDLVRQVED